MVEPGLSSELSSEPPAAQYLKSVEAPFRVFVHSADIRSLEDAAQQRGQTPEQVIRSLLFRLPDHSFVMVLVSGPGQIDWRMLRQQLNLTRMAMATPEEVMDVTGCQPGTVSPFGMKRPVRILVDEDILHLNEISFGSGERGKAILIQVSAALKAIDHPEIISLVKR